MINYKTLLLASIWSTFSFGQASYLPFSTTLDKGGNEASVKGTYWQSQTRINSDGEEVPFVDNESFQKVDVELLVKYGLTDDLEMGVGALYRQNLSVEVVGNEEENLTSNGVKSGIFQLKYSLPREGRWQFAAEVSFLKDFISNSEGSKDLVLGDDGDSTSFGLSGSYRFPSMNFISGRVHYRNPSSALSSEVVSSAEYVLLWKRVSLLGGVENVTSLNQDPYDDDPSEKPSVNTGSTYLYNSINRSWTAPYIGFNFSLGDHWRVETRAETRLNTVSSDKGSAFSLMIARRNSAPRALEQKRQAFKQYSIDARVVKLTKSKSSVIIDVGLSQGMEKGSKVDFYHFDYLGGNELIASGYTVRVGTSKSMVKITKRYSKKQVQDGTIARSGLVKE
ncbi:MAG: hypothetical protein CME67_06095 [Halobacteriovoraceae bacterium]|nr:hypothetical protein [Peredibacter sp.]MBJ00787.1 hypothetical protein [Halobacteriovoraceae bacterium]|tara:strand:- start:15079 stop:16257 length:1179 start_codon:yes stop_codon:yes gene_type:complete